VVALNIIKPPETIATVVAGKDNQSVAQDASLLVGLTQGSQVITAAMVDALAPGAVLLDGGRALRARRYSAGAGEGYYYLPRRYPIWLSKDIWVWCWKPSALLSTPWVARNSMVCLVVSGGLLASNEVVVDSITDPHAVFGLADGLGDFVRVLDDNQADRLQVVHNYILRKGEKNVSKHSGIFERH
jgi:hypothetical protein